MYASGTEEQAAGSWRSRYRQTDPASGPRPPTQTRPFPSISVLTTLRTARGARGVHASGTEQQAAGSWRSRCRQIDPASGPRPPTQTRPFPCSSSSPPQLRCRLELPCIRLVLPLLRSRSVLTSKRASRARIGAGDGLRATCSRLGSYTSQPYRTLVRFQSAWPLHPLTISRSVLASHGMAGTSAPFGAAADRRVSTP